MGYRSGMHGPAPEPRPIPSSAIPADLLEAVRQLKRGTVLVVGDAMLDRYVYGRVERISPEAPIPVLAVEREVALPGGAGNVVRNLTALGAAVAFVSIVGDDQAGSDLTGLIGGGVRADLPTQVSDHRSRIGPRASRRNRNPRLLPASE